MSARIADGVLYRAAYTHHQICLCERHEARAPFVLGPVLAGRGVHKCSLCQMEAFDAEVEVLRGERGTRGKRG